MKNSKLTPVSKTTTLMSTKFSDKHLDIKCEECGDDKFAKIVTPEGAEHIFGEYRVRPVMCSCQIEEARKEREFNERSDDNRRLLRMLGDSMMNKQMIGFTFETWDDSVIAANYKRLALNYVENWDKVKEDNYGLFLHGNPGAGKTFMTSCIANALITKKRVPVAFISPISFINRIYNTYGDSKENESMIIKALDKADLLIVDDLGAENSNGMKAKEILYQVLDNRLRLGKPLIVTSNFSIDQLKDRLDYDGIGRSIDRILEMCSSFEVKNQSIRQKKAEKKKTDFINLLTGKGED